MGSFFKFVRRAQTLPDVHHQESRHHFFQNQCRVLGEQISIAEDIFSDHALCPESALPELRRVVRIGETLIVGCQNEICAHKAYLRLEDRTKAFEETLTEILWCISVVFCSKEKCLTGNPSFLAMGEFPQAMLGAKEKYVLHKAALADEGVLLASLDIWIDKHVCSAEECGRHQRQSSGALCLAAQIRNRKTSSSRGPDHKSSLWITVQKSLVDVRQIGKGSFGTVFETMWLGDAYAKKEFDTHCKDFADEANALAKLNHPHIVKVFTASSESCTPCFFLMEKMPYNLRTHMSWRMNRHGINPPFSISAGIDLMLQISEAMSYMNSEGMVHRDLKAENILVEPVGDQADYCDGFVIAKLADFGLAKVKHEVTSCMTRNTGTRRWMAPEVFGAHLDDEEENESLKVFPRKADVYSFGIVCSEILTGNAPFYNIPFKARELYKLITDPKNPLRPELPQSCPASLASLVCECWQTDPVMRPTFKEISTTLRYFKGQLMLEGAGDLLNFESPSWRTFRASLGTPFSTDTKQEPENFAKNITETKFTNARNQIAQLKENLDPQMSLEGDTQSKIELEEELEIVKETMEREAEDNEIAQAEYRLKIKKLEEQVSNLTCAYSTLVAQIEQSETEIIESERLLHAAEDVLKRLKFDEDSEQKRELVTVAKGMEGGSDEKAVLKGELATIYEVDVHAQMSERISELTKKVEVLENENVVLCNEIDSEVAKLESIIDSKDAKLVLADLDRAFATRILEREIQELKLEVSNDKAEMKRLQVEMEEVSKFGQEASLRIIDLEEARGVLEARFAALLKDKKRASVKASEEILKLESECKELRSLLCAL